MDHLDAAKLTGFQDFNKILHPEQRRSCRSGDFNAAQTKEWIQNTLVR
jgi:hypothetical protein